MMNLIFVIILVSIGFYILIDSCFRNIESAVAGMIVGTILLIGASFAGITKDWSWLKVGSARADVQCKSDRTEKTRFSLYVGDIE